MKTTTIFIILFSINLFAKSQNALKKFITIHASKNYELAKRVATEANKNLAYKLNFIDLESNKLLGLSLLKNTCKKYNFEFPTYIQRRQNNDNNIISIVYYKRPLQRTTNR